MRRSVVLAVLAVYPCTLPATAQDDLVHACVKKRNGSVRIVGNPADCRTSERAVDWFKAPPTKRVPRGPEFVGCSDEEVDGGHGIMRMNRLCRQRFGVNARMCTSAQILVSADPAQTGSTVHCWVHPVFAPHTSNFPDQDGESAVLDVAGETNIAQDIVRPGSLSCRAWTGGVESLRGYAVRPDTGAFSARICSNEARVACCSP